MITFEEAKACGLKVAMLELGTPLWDTIWELYMRSSVIFRRKGTYKLVECASASFTGAVQR